MKTKKLLLTTGLTILIMLLTTIFTNAQIPIQGLAADHEGFAGWDADGSGPEPEAYGHTHPYGYGSSLYYGASRDYVDSDPGAAFCHFLDNITGFPLFVQTLADNGFTPGQVKVKTGLFSVKEDIEGEDWFTIDTMHYFNRYAAYYFIELNGEPMISCYMNYMNCYVNSIDDFWQGIGSFSSPFNASANSSLEVKEVAAAFEKEDQTNELVLFPIRLDDLVMETPAGWAADIRRMRHITDFKGWKEHDRYQAGLERLLRDLKVEEDQGQGSQSGRL